ncbi:MAG: hypothetical protein J6Q98_00485 [Bacteroidaceae bacterium]|nr:hypothetical protein [Bacteroidaceae bacterium]
MKKIALFITFILLATTVVTAQEQKKGEGRRKFSPEEFQAKQREFIVKEAGLTQEEADAFFPLFFELQKSKFKIEHEARKKTSYKRGEKMSEEQCREFVNNMADAKIKVAELEKEYIEKYLKVISPCKLLKVQHAEGRFQRELMKKMVQRHDRKKKPSERK